MESNTIRLDINLLIQKLKRFDAQQRYRNSDKGRIAIHNAKLKYKNKT